MTPRARSARALLLSLLLFAIAVSGFVAAGIAREGSERTAPNTGEGASLAGSSQVASLPGSTSAAVPVVRTAPSEWLGRSGRLRAIIDTPESLGERFASDSLAASSGFTPGLHDVGMVTPQGDRFVVVTLTPYEANEGRRVNGYYVGSWPAPRPGTGDRYARPAGFIEVTKENGSTPVSQSFTLQDFLTHDQQGVWPKVLVLKPRLLDKLELISAALAARGLPSKLHVMSGFRTPQYNEQGVGKKGGRASLSRHMYGDASDVFVDADGNGMMDDLDGDGKSTIADARVLFTVAESVEAANPDLIGGLSPYGSNGAHGPFVHVDARGVRARW